MSRFLEPSDKEPTTKKNKGPKQQKVESQTTDPQQQWLPKVITYLVELLKTMVCMGPVLFSTRVNGLILPGKAKRKRTATADSGGGTTIGVNILAMCFKENTTIAFNGTIYHSASSQGRVLIWFMFRV